MPKVSGWASLPNHKSIIISRLKDEQISPFLYIHVCGTRAKETEGVQCIDIRMGLNSYFPLLTLVLSSLTEKSLIFVIFG